MRTTYRAAIALTLSALFWIASATVATAVPRERTSRKIAPGVTLVRLRYEDLPVRAFVLRVVVGERWSVEPALADRAFPLYASTLEIARREHAIAAVNGDFGHGRPVHPLAVAGTLITSGEPGKVVAFAADRAAGYVGPPRIRVIADQATGSRAQIEAWNSGPPSGGEVVGFSPAGGLLESPPPNACSARLLPETAPEPVGHPSWISAEYVVDQVRCGQNPLEVRQGVVLSSRRSGSGARWIRSLTSTMVVDVRWSSRWPSLASMQGGYPMLVRHGVVVVSSSCHELFCLRQPRTGIGIGSGCVDPDAETPCVVSLVVVDGRRAGWSAGLTLVAFARLMRRVGAVEALNMDGGGSTQLVVQGRVINRPTERPLRDVPASWVIAGKGGRA